MFSSKPVNLSASEALSAFCGNWLWNGKSQPLTADGLKKWHTHTQVFAITFTFRKLWQLHFIENGIAINSIAFQNFPLHYHHSKYNCLPLKRFLLPSLVESAVPCFPFHGKKAFLAALLYVKSLAVCHDVMSPCHVIQNLCLEKHPIQSMVQMQRRPTTYLQTIKTEYLRG